jgi:hypothetical protein
VKLARSYLLCSKQAGDRTKFASLGVAPRLIYTSSTPTHANDGEQLRHCGSNFARRRSGVRIPSAPLIKGLAEALPGDA